MFLACSSTEYIRKVKREKLLALFMENKGSDGDYILDKTIVPHLSLLQLLTLQDGSLHATVFFLLSLLHSLFYFFSFPPANTLIVALTWMCSSSRVFDGEWLSQSVCLLVHQSICLCDGGRVGGGKVE